MSLMPNCKPTWEHLPFESNNKHFFTFTTVLLNLGFAVPQCLKLPPTRTLHLTLPFRNGQINGFEFSLPLDCCGFAGNF